MQGTAQSSPGLILPLCPQRCLRDILDGFFPSELQRLYPDGVPFKVMGCSQNHSLPPSVGILQRGWDCFLRPHLEALPHLRGSPFSSHRLMTSRRRGHLKPGWEGSWEAAVTPGAPAASAAAGKAGG